MIYLILAIICGTSLALAFSVADKLKLDSMNITLVNYIAACIVCAFNLSREINSGAFSFGNLGAYTVPLSVIAGAAALAGFSTIQKSVVANGPSATAMFSKLAMVVPVLVSIVFLKEYAGPLRWIGIILAIVSLVMFNWEGGFKINLLLLLVWVSGGCAECCSNLFARFCDPADNTFYLTLLFGVASVLTAIVIAKSKGPKFTGKEIAYGAVLGCLNIGNIGFMVESFQHLPTTIVSPVICVSVILITALCGKAFFGDKFSRRQTAALCLTVTALVILNL